MHFEKIFSNMKSLWVLAALVSVLSACGGGSDSDDGDNGNDHEDETPHAASAVFVDAGVAGLSYSSASYQGTTNSVGAFEYAPGETTTFSYGGLVIGSVTTPESSSVFTPLDLFETSNVNDQRVINMIVFLQSLDSDGNPNNGIYLNPVVPGSGVDVSGLDFTNDSASFRSSLLTAAFPENLEHELVSEEDAIEHFEINLQAINAGLQLVGTWLERNDNGEIRYKHTFDSNGGMTAVSYTNCDNDDQYKSPTEASLARNCNSSTSSYTYEFANREIRIYSGGELADVCTVLRSSERSYDATCTTDAFIHLERVISDLDETLIADSYRLVQAGSSSFSTITFNQLDNTGAFQSYSDGVPEGGTTGSGTITYWAASGTDLTYSGTFSDGETTFSDTLTLTNGNSGINGALVTTSEVEGDVQLLIPDFNEDVVRGVVTQTLYGVYDAVTGKCKAVYAFYYDGVSTQLEMMDDIGTDEICQYDANNLGQSGNTSPVWYRWGSMVIDGQNPQICWPISYNTTAENGSYTQFACSLDSGANGFSYELWYSL